MIFAYSRSSAITTILRMRLNTVNKNFFWQLKNLSKFGTKLFFNWKLVNWKNWIKAAFKWIGCKKFNHFFRKSTNIFFYWKKSCTVCKWTYANKLDVNDKLSSCEQTIIDIFTIFQFFVLSTALGTLVPSYRGSL